MLALSGIYIGLANNRYYFLQAAEAGDILHARSLLAGEGFRDTHRLGAPYTVVRPPGLSFLLAAVFAVSGESLYAGKLVNNLFMPLGFAVAFLLLRRLGHGFWTSLIASVWWACLPMWAEMSRYFYSGAGYAFFLFLALYAFERGRRERRFVAWMAASGLAAAAGWYLRSIGISFFAAALGALLTGRGLEPRRRAAGVAVLLAALALGPGLWTARNYSVSARDQPYLSKLLVGEPLDSIYWLAEDQGVPLMPKPRRLTALALARRMGDNLIFYLDRAPVLLCAPALSLPRPLRFALTIALAIPVLAGLLLLVRRREGIAEWQVAATFGVMLLWPFPHERYLAEIAPLLVHLGIAGISGAAAIFNRWPGPRTRLAVSAAAVILIIVNLGAVRQQLRLRFQTPTYSRALTDKIIAATDRPEAWDSLQMLVAARQLAPPEAVVMFHSAAACSLIANRTCVSVPVSPPGRVISFIDENVDFVVDDNENGAWGAALLSDLYLKPALQSNPDRFDTMASFPPGSPHPARLLRVKKP